MASSSHRFHHLLQPIRDLADNWSVDIATELEEYLADLESLCISFDGGATKVNFSEAALVIQGSACVYSKKVEFLYKLVNKCIDILHQRQEQGTTTNSDGVDSDVVLFEDPAFLPLDDIEQGREKDIDILEDTTGDVNDLLDTERVPLCMLSLAKKSGGEDAEFTLASCRISSSGAVILESNDSENHDWAAESGAGAGAGAVSAIEEFGFEGGDDNDDGDDFGFDAGIEENDGTARQVAGKTAAGLVHHSARSTAMTVDPWAELNPHEAPENAPKPCCKGKPWRRPRAPTNDVLLDRQVPVLPEVATLTGIAFPESMSFFARERARRRAHILLTRLAMVGNNTVDSSALNQYDDDANDFFGDDGDDNDMVEGGASADEVAVSEEDQALSVDDVSWLGIEGDSGANPWDDDNDISAGPSYEDMCRSYIDEFMAGADAWAAETQLSRRVGEWQQRIEPSLEAEKLRPAYDIKMYQSQVMGNVAKTSKSKKDVRSTFAEVVKGCEPYEIARLFLATLQCANEGNVDIEFHRQSMNMKVHLLNDELRQNITAYTAPSIASAKKKRVKTTDSSQPTGDKENAVAVPASKSSQLSQKVTQPTTAAAPTRRSNRGLSAQ